MKLLFDQNLSPRLVSLLSDLYPDSAHTSNLDLGCAPDDKVWDFARNNGFIIVSKDADFSEMTVVRGFPPKVVWIRRGNCATGDIADILRRDFSMVEELAKNASLGILLLY